MKKGFMTVFSMIYLVFTAATLFLSAEAALTAYGKPFLPVDFWQAESISNLLAKSESESIGNFLSSATLLAQILCFVLFLICKSIGDSIMKPQRQYNSLTEFSAFTRNNLLIYSIGNLFFFFSVAGHIIESIPRGDDGEIILTCLFFGIPGLLFAVLVLPSAFSVIFSGKPNELSYCGYCNYGSKKQYVITDKKHLHDNVTYQTTTTKVNGQVAKVETQETRQHVYRNTYSCMHCGRSFSRVRVE